MHDVANPLPLEDLGETLGHLPADRSVETISNNLALISSISHPNRILSLLNRILGDKAVLALIASRSYHHVNHFDKIVLIDSDSPAGYRLTLHLWRPPYTADELDDEIIHSHRFSFWSAILAGELQSENFQIGEDGTIFRRYSYVPEKRTKVNFYEFCGEARLRRIDVSVQAAGTSYYLPYEQIHRVLLPHRTMTCTLVLRGPRARNHSDVYNTSYPETNTQSANRTFSRDELADKLHALKQIIAVRLSSNGALGA